VVVIGFASFRDRLSCVWRWMASRDTILCGQLKADGEHTNIVPFPCVGESHSVSLLSAVKGGGIPNA
jgi:hypothetical protein